MSVMTHGVLIPEMSVHTNDVSPVTPEFMHIAFLVNKLVGSGSTNSIEETCRKDKHKQLECSGRSLLFENPPVGLVITKQK